MTYTITRLLAREVLDSRGNPTVEAELTLDTTTTARAIVPSGASTGVHEALELRDGDKSRYLGKGTLTAVQNVNTTIKDALLNKTFATYRELDQLLISLDGTPNKSKLGANAILAVSMAFVAAVAKKEGHFIYEELGAGQGNTLPYPMMNILNGGSHADNNVDIQEFMIVPTEASNFREGLRMGAEVFHHLKAILKAKRLATSVGDEGGFAPNLASNEEALQVIMEAIQQAGYTGKIKLALDVASSEFYKDGMYDLAGEGRVLTDDELIQLYVDWCNKYPIISIEDGMAEDDFNGRKKLTEQLGSKIMLVGDDLFVTNIQRLQLGIDQGMANAILIKLNQIGTVSETLDAINLAHANGMRSIASHRSGESEDTFIADLAVAMNTGFIKTGSASRTDRIAKYNQLLRIEEQLQETARYGKN
ncbi:MAG: phosphopyruvate hydratase [Candidatus Peribacteria bacterium]|jgi:enolase|nr:phosphopyruvate hydratase [Candidatus Peribacteria bacterium]